jgi:hypothetical protein
MTTMTTTQPEQQSNTEKDDSNYPPSKIVLPAIAAIWLAFFVVALVLSSHHLENHATNSACRIEPSLAQLFLLSLKISAASVI